MKEKLTAIQPHVQAAYEAIRADRNRNANEVTPARMVETIGLITAAIQATNEALGQEDEDLDLRYAGTSPTLSVSENAYLRSMRDQLAVVYRAYDGVKEEEDQTGNNFVFHEDVAKSVNDGIPAQIAAIDAAPKGKMATVVGWAKSGKKGAEEFADSKAGIAVLLGGTAFGMNALINSAKSGSSYGITGTVLLAFTALVLLTSMYKKVTEEPAPARAAAPHH